MGGGVWGFGYDFLGLRPLRLFFHHVESYLCVKAYIDSYALTIFAVMWFGGDLASWEGGRVGQIWGFRPLILFISMLKVTTVRSAKIHLNILLMH